MIIPTPVKGKRLDNLGRLYNIKRRKFFGITLESDDKYRNRITKKMREKCNEDGNKDRDT